MTGWACLGLEAAGINPLSLAKGGKSPIDYLQSEKGEILVLKQAGTESINLSYIEMMEVDPFGNQTRQRSTFRRVPKGSEESVAHQVIDVWFNTLVSQ